MVKSKTVYVCQNCGAKEAKWTGRCNVCGEWNSFVEEVEVTSKSRGNAIIGNPSSKALRLSEIKVNADVRMDTGDNELNRVLGGGMVPGSMILLGGEPGIGKSTLVLQFALHNRCGKVLYVSGEESISQIKMRAQRLGTENDECLFLSGNSLEMVLQHARAILPDLLIIDSIQTLATEAVDSIPGSLSQIRECTNTLLRFSKENTISTILIGHITKDGQLAGPKILEHMVDTVLYFEGERHHTFRILRAVKNRFGSTNEIGIFEMQSGGLVEVLNPSQVFLEERLDGATGSAIVVTMEGSRPILAEVQALVTPTVFGNAKRTTTGLDFNRVSLIMAVLEKRCGLLLQNQDAYLKSAGGVKLDEPAIDLAVAVAIASSYKELPTNPQEAFVGEIGLTGEIRRVTRIEQRINEAAKLGFTKIYVPKNSLHGMKIPEGIQVIGVTTVGEVLKKVFS